MRGYFAKYPFIGYFMLPLGYFARYPSVGYFGIPLGYFLKYYIGYFGVTFGVLLEVPFYRVLRGTIGVFHEVP